MRPLVRVSRWVTITKIFIVMTVAMLLLLCHVVFFPGEYREDYKKGKRK